MVGLAFAKRNSVRRSPTPSAPNSFASFAESISVIFAKTLIILPSFVIALSRRFW